MEDSCELKVCTEEDISSGEESEESPINWRRLNVLPRQALNEYKGCNKPRIQIVLTGERRKKSINKKILKFPLRND